jgi:hypothetical protein
MPWLGYDHFVEDIGSRIILSLSELSPENVDETTESIARIGNLVNTRTVEAFMIVANVIYQFATGISTVDESKNMTSFAALCNNLDRYIQQNAAGESLYYMDHDGQRLPRLGVLSKAMRRVSDNVLEDDNIQADVRARMETVWEFWRDHLFAA